MTTQKTYGVEAIGVGLLALAAVVFSNLDSTSGLLREAQASGGLPKMIADLLTNPAFQVLLVLVALGLGVKAVRGGDGGIPVRSESDASSAVATMPPEYQWLIEIAARELHPDTMCAHAHLAQVEWHTDGTSPHAVLVILVWNMAVWPIAILPTLTGRVTYAGIEFPAAPEFHQPPETIPHGRGVVVRLRQRVNGAMLLHVQEKAPNGVAAIGLEQLHLRGSRGPHGAEVETRIEINSTGLIQLPQAMPVH